VLDLHTQKIRDTFWPMEKRFETPIFSYTDPDKDVFEAQVDRDIPTLMDIRVNGCEALLIRTDSAEAIAELILKAAREARTPTLQTSEQISDFAKRWDARVAAGKQ
jgi:hypothetical protein